MSVVMDDDFRYFYEDEKFGPAEQTRTVPLASIERFRGKLPDQLLEYWRLYGWSGYGKGLFWTVDPEEYQPVLAEWLADTPFIRQDTFHIIGRSAFGLLFLWGTNSGRSLKINAPWGTIFPSDQSEGIRAGRADVMVRQFFVLMTKDELDQQDSLQRPLFDRALKTLGPLAADEMYGFEPALVLGGKPELKNLRKVKAVEHLAILAQLGERKLMRDIARDARNAGLM